VSRKDFALDTIFNGIKKTGRKGASGLFYHRGWKNSFINSNYKLFCKLPVAGDKCFHHIRISQGGDISQLIKFVGGNFP